MCFLIVTYCFLKESVNFRRRFGNAMESAKVFPNIVTENTKTVGLWIALENVQRVRLIFGAMESVKVYNYPAMACVILLILTYAPMQIFVSRVILTLAMIQRFQNMNLIQVLHYPMVFVQVSGSSVKILKINVKSGMES